MVCQGSRTDDEGRHVDGNARNGALAALNQGFAVNCEALDDISVGIGARACAAEPTFAYS